MKVQINNPCHEKMVNMTATEKGRFCAVCQKEVIDFTKFTDAALKAYLLQNKAGSCGTFRKDQLDRTLVQTAPTRSFKASRWLMSFALLLGACERDKVGKTAIEEDKKTTDCKKPIESESYATTTGEVDMQGLPAMRVQGFAMRGYRNHAEGWTDIKVHIKGTKFSCLTDSNGHFSIQTRFAQDSTSNKITLIFTDQEGKTIEIEMDKNDLAKEKIFYMEFDEERLEQLRNGAYGIIDFPAKKQSIWQRIKQRFQKGDIA